MYFYFDLNNILVFLVIGLAAGFVANSLAGKRNSSLVTNLILGLAGAFIGGWILPGIGLRPWGIVGNFLTATVGAVIIIVAARVLNSSNSRI